MTDWATQTASGPTVAGNVKVFPVRSDHRQEPVCSLSLDLMKSKVKSQAASGVQTAARQSHWKLQLVLHPPNFSSLSCFCKEDTPTDFPQRKVCFLWLFLEFA